jgi:hypothetical protein
MSENRLLMKARRVVFNHSRIDLIAKRSDNKRFRCVKRLSLREKRDELLAQDMLSGSDAIA